MGSDLNMGSHIMAYRSSVIYAVYKSLSMLIFGICIYIYTYIHVYTHTCCVAIEVYQDVYAILRYELRAFTIRLVAREVGEVLHVLLEAPAAIVWVRVSMCVCVCV